MPTRNLTPSLPPRLRRPRAAAKRGIHEKLPRLGRKTAYTWRIARRSRNNGEQ